MASSRFRVPHSVGNGDVVQIHHGILLNCLGSYLQVEIKSVPLGVASESRSEKYAVLRRANSDRGRNPATAASPPSGPECNATAGIVTSLF